jgi:hypothetical protein
MVHDQGANIIAPDQSQSKFGFCSLKKDSIASNYKGNDGKERIWGSIRDVGDKVD